jgi:Transposase DDE domain group 1
VNTTGWLKGLQVTADGTGIVSHAGVALLLALADNIGLTAGLSKALASDRLLVHDRGRVLADLACAIADGAEVISDFRVMGDQEDLFGLVASVPTAWRTLDEIAGGGQRALGRITAAVNAARRRAWAAIEARHGALPGIRIADKTLGGVTCIRLDASVVACHSDKEGAEPNFKGFGLLTELPGLSSQFREWVAPGAVTVLDHDRTRRSSLGYGEPRRAAGWFPSGHGRSVGSVSAGRSVG